ncbi:hypothetical protein AB4Z02_15080, partial [Pedococcus sp. 2YAF34]
ARYASQYPCMAAALTNWVPRIDEAFRSDQFHITVEVAPQRAGYRPGEEPRWGEKRPADCGELPDPHTSQTRPLPGKKFDDGTDNVGGYSSDPQFAALPSLFAGASGAAVADPDAGLAGTEQEQRVVTALLDPTARPTPSAITTLLAGPILRGTTVSQGAEPQRAEPQGAEPQGGEPHGGAAG